MGSEIVEGSSRAQPSLMLRATMKATGKLVEVGGVYQTTTCVALDCSERISFLGLQSCTQNWTEQESDDIPLCDKGLSGGAYHSGGQEENDANSSGSETRVGLQDRLHVQTGT